ncbi:MAG: tripartite tricarboxylate transporter TctB family protein [Spirochaetota bacterium]
MKNVDRVSAIILLGICAYFWAESQQFTRYGAFFPQVITIILGFLCFLLLIFSFIKPEKSKVFGRVTARYITIALCVVLIVAWAAFIKTLGFVATSVLFFSIMYILLDERKRRPRDIFLKIVIVAAVVGIFYLFFATLLQVPFPRGVLL